MYKTLAAGAIGVKFNSLADAVSGAKRHGFAGLEFSAQQVADLIDQNGIAATKKVFDDANIKPAVFGLSVNWRGSDEDFAHSIMEFPRLAHAAQSVGCTRTATWIMPCSNDRALEENRCFHIERLKPVAKILAECEINLGLEFIGPKTLRDSQKHPFIHAMTDMLAMAAEIGPNVGLLLDSFHWYTSHATIADLKNLRPSQIVYVHVNDAQRGLEIDQQLDNVRDLPGATGVIDLRGFMQALVEIGYDGPLAVEPFKKDLAQLSNDEARLKAVSESLNKIMPRL